MLSIANLLTVGIPLFCLIVIVGVLFTYTQLKLATFRHIDRPPHYLLAGLGLLFSLGIAEAAPRSVTLAWDYSVADEAFITGYILERKDGQTGTYAQVPVTIAPTARTVVDVTASTGQVQCWRLFASKPPALSPPSNEVCDVVLLGPINLRLQ